jgi:hypothetical protein
MLRRSAGAAGLVFHFRTGFHNGCTAGAPCGGDDGGLTSVDGTKVVAGPLAVAGAGFWPSMEARKTRAKTAFGACFAGIPQTIAGVLEEVVCNLAETWVFTKATQYLVLWT